MAGAISPIRPKGVLLHSACSDHALSHAAELGLRFQCSLCCAARLPKRTPPKDEVYSKASVLDDQSSLGSPSSFIPSTTWMAHVDPKVMAAYSHSAGEPPRDVIIQRTRKAYKHFDLAASLRSFGLDSCSTESMLPGTVAVHFFDDESFESRTPAEWVPKNGLPAAKARIVSPAAKDPAQAFRHATVHDVNPCTNMYLVAFANQPNTPQWVHRLFICFDAEDPKKYAQRLAAAYRGRADAERTLRLSLLVDCMPYGDVPQLSVEQINRMLNYALNNKALKTQMKLMDTSMLISEINIDYARTLNQLVFNSLMQPRPNLSSESGDEPYSITTAEHGRFEALQPADKLTPVPARAAPAGGTVPVPVYDFPERFSQFVFASLLTKQEAIQALVRTRQECVRLLDRNLFHLSSNKTLPVIDFLQVRYDSLYAIFVSFLLAKGQESRSHSPRSLVRYL